MIPINSLLRGLSLWNGILLEGILASVSLAAVSNTNALGLVAAANAPDIVLIDFESARLVAVARAEAAAVRLILAVAIIQLGAGASARVGSNGHRDLVCSFRFLCVCGDREGGMCTRTEGMRCPSPYLYICPP